MQGGENNSEVGIRGLRSGGLFVLAMATKFGVLRSSVEPGVESGTALAEPVLYGFAGYVPAHAKTL